ncbi:MAG: permease [Candidatus Cloacimonetes bacterium]|nr:permease [Candidatus Cloacimonadota bacterium]
MKSEQKKRSGGSNIGGKISGIYFLATVIFVYLLLFLINSSGAKESITISIKILKSIIPILIIVIFFTFIINFFLKPQKIVKYLSKESGIKGWVIATISGIISHGPPFVWYPMIQGLREKGMSTGLSAVFFYNRAIKIPLLPMMIFYFSLKFVVVLTVLMIIASFVVWKVMDFINR